MKISEQVEADVVRSVAPIFIFFGLAVRVWLLFNPVGSLDSDEAVVGLMARRILEGEFPLFYWGQSHGGPHEPLLTAAFFKVFGSSVLVLKVVAILLSAAVCLLIWRVGKRTVGDRAAIIAGLLFWVWPAAFVWWSVKSRGFYHAGLVIGLAIFLLILRLDERDSRLDVFFLGALVANGFWATPQTIFFSIPGLLWLLFRRIKARRFKIFAHAPLAIVGGILAALPWFIHNLQKDWVALRASPASLEMPAYGDHLEGFFVKGLPNALGLKLADGSRWMGEFLGQAWYIVLLALFAWAFVKLRGRTSLLLLMAVMYPFLFALSSYAWFVDHPRYLYFLGPVLALLIGRGLSAFRGWRPIAGLVAAMLLTSVAFATMNREAIFYPTAEGQQIPPDLEPLFAYMIERDIDRVYADYWLAYHLAFESDEEIVMTPYRGGLRDFAANDAVRSAPEPAYLFLSGTISETIFQQQMSEMGIAPERHAVNGFSIYRLPVNVFPETLQAMQNAQI